MRHVMPGKLLRAPYLFDQSTPIIIAPVDDLLIFGPVGGLERPQERIKDIAGSGADAILTFCGSLSRNAMCLRHVSCLVNLSASLVGPNHTRKTPAHSVEHAIRCGADGVAFHINIGSRHVSEMLSAASSMISEAERFGLPSFGIVYPRGEDAGSRDLNFDDLKTENPREFGKMVAHCVSIAVDLGFDAVKTVYTNNPETFAAAVECADEVPVLIAGGPLLEESDALEKARLAISAGAAGISFGRNFFGRSGDLRSFVRAVKGMQRAQ